MAMAQSKRMWNGLGLSGVLGAVAAVGLVGAPAALAQSIGAGGGQTAATANPARTNLMKLGRRITIDLSDQRLEDVLNFIVEVTGAELEPVWTTDNAEGLDRDARITLSANNLPALTLLERVLEKAQTDFRQHTWQLTSYGTVEVGPKERLNRSRRLVIYDVNDLLTELPRFYDAPQIDLQGVLQQSQGGGGGQSPFNQNQQDQRDEAEEEERREMRVQRLIDLITTFIETEQWQDNGGDGGTIRYFQGTLLINAPDYMHRQINGYSFWPERSARTSASGRRYVSLNMDTGISTLDGFGREPVTAVVGGRLIRSGDGGPGGNSGGGKQTPAPQNPPPKGEKPASDKPQNEKPKNDEPK
jgi:hypothetical protein